MRFLPVVAIVTVALPLASAAAQAPGLPRTFDVTRVDSPTPVGGGAFGWGIWSSDLTGDRKQDLLVAQAQVGTAADPNKIFIFNGTNGQLVDTITPPEDNPLSAAGAYQSPEMGFVYVETMPDLGSCPGGDGGDADKICDLTTIAPGDGIPEILVGSRALRVNATNGALPPTNADRPVGRGYVIDGATRAVLKRIDMPVADRQQNLTLAGSPAFGRTMASPQGMPPCNGVVSEGNDTGVGACPPLTDLRYPRAVRIGDLDGGGQPDIVITARGFPETIGPTGTAAPGSQCSTATTGSCGAGKAWTYRGEDIAATNPRDILATPLHSIKNPDAQTSGGEFGGNMFRVGDVTGPGASGASALPDGVPDYVIPYRGSDHPLKNPDLVSGLNMGSANLFSGSNGAPRGTIVAPDAQIRSQFSGNFNAGRAVGDLGATSTPDILLPAALQDSWERSDEGKLWVFNGDTTAGGGGEQSWNFATLTDPSPYNGGTFGGGITGVGNLVDGPTGPANEVLVGGFKFDSFTEASANVVPDVHFMNATLNSNLMTIPHPEGARGDGFGVGITPMGDLNGDGFLDFAVSAYLANGVTGGQGRAWIFQSNNSPLPPPPTVAAPQIAGPAAPQPAAADMLRPGTCANRTMGTDRGERIRGTIAGDEIFGFGGNDSVSGYQGRDCLDGATGKDTLYGGDGNDKLVGGSGNDRLIGQDDRDELFGGVGSDRLEGGAANDMLAGGSGDDDLIGGSGSDRLFGEAGSDRIVGGGGLNQIDGGAGDDVIMARNGERDRIICGTGRDRVHADRFDRLNGCEIVRFGGTITDRTVLPPRAVASSVRASRGRTTR